MREARPECRAWTVHVHIRAYPNQRKSNFLCARAARPARLLTEEGGSRPPPMVRVPSRVPAIHASLALRGPALHATWVTQLADRYLQPHTIMVHVSDGRSANATMVTLSVRAHLLLNPESRRVAKNGPGILGVHLSNLELLLHSEIHPDDDDTFVLVASNQQFFRPCRARACAATQPLLLARADGRCMEVQEGHA